MTEILSVFQSIDLSGLATVAQLLNSFGLLWPTVQTGLWVVLFLWCFWVLYVATMGVYRLKLAGELHAATTSRFTLSLAYSLVIVAVLVDVVAQYTVASVMFLELPRKGEHLVTDRLQRHMAKLNPDWRVRLADWICLHILDLFDPSKNHCDRRSLT